MIDTILDPEEEVLAPGLKRCRRCQKVKVLTDFYFTAKKPKAPGERSRMGQCSECHRTLTARRRRERLVNEGQGYLDAEAKRVGGYTSNPLVAEDRRAAARASRKADKWLREKHSTEYDRLLQAARREEGLAA